MPTRSSSREHLMGMFRSLAMERVERLNNDFVQLERTPDDKELAETVMRDIHSLKGEARMMGLHDINVVAHKTEDLIHLAHRRDFSIIREVSDLVLQGFDLLGALVQEDPEPGLDPNAFSAKVEAAVHAIEDGGLAPTPEAPEMPPEVAAAGPAEEVEEAPRTVQGRKRDAFLRVGLKKLNRLTEVSGDLVFRHARAERTLGDLMAITVDSAATLQRGRSVMATLRDPNEATRVQLTTLITQLSELLVESQRLALGAIDLVAQAREQSFDDGLQVDALDSTVRDLRFLPIASLFATLPRAARDLAREQGKTVSVEVSGGAVEVDKQVLDLLAEPLLHLVRNCVDHGIEPPAERERAGKPAEGRVLLRALQVGSSVEITVQEDGYGLDLDRIRATAVERGLLNDEEAEILEDKRAADLIFLSGFTTRQEVTDVSGRGVGLSVVRKQVTALGGSLSVETTKGMGTSFGLRVPISMVLSNALLVEVGDAYMAFPSDAVEQALLVQPEDVEVTGQGTVFKRDEERTPLADLGMLLGGSPTPTNGGGMPTIILAHEGRRLGLRVSRFRGEHQMVQRRLDPFVDGLRLVQGTVAMPGGELALMLRVPQVMREAMFRSLWSAKPAEAKEARKQTILVVDDSEFTRDMVASLLRDLGYAVVEAVNGQQGLEKVQEHRPDLVLTDLSMPVLDGFGFLEQLRSLSGQGEVPVVVLSTRGSPEDKRRASELGADGYLVKSDFREDALARTVRRFLQHPGG